MGFFDWLAGKPKKTESQPKLPRPKVLAGLEDGSPQVLVDTGNGMVTVMDREMFDYMYTESNAPDPEQRHLDELRPKVSRIRAIASGLFRGRALGKEVVLETSDGRALTDFWACLKIVEDPATFSHCGCLG